MNSMIKINQTSKWQLYAIVTDIYMDGSVYTKAIKLTEFKDLSKEYMTVIYKHHYNSMCRITRSNKHKNARSVYDKRHNTLSTSHACIITRPYGNEHILAVAGRSGYQITSKEGDLLLVRPKEFYL
jgi:hypothetical protein